MGEIVRLDYLDAVQVHAVTLQLKTPGPAMRPNRPCHL